MSYKKEKMQIMDLQVTEDLTVTIIPDSNHEFLMQTKDVAIGYGVSQSRISHHLFQHSDELIEGKHLIRHMRIPHRANNGVSLGQMWTKRGIVRLGFFIKSERAKLFRDWAEELVINKLDTHLVSIPGKVSQLPAKHAYYNNRLTHERVADIMFDVCQIEDKKLRLSISNKIMKGGSL